jgi:oxygen-independent coproporphyrinogen III oxidase
MPGLYVHVPFCERRCVYCDFYSVETTAAATPDHPGSGSAQGSAFAGFVDSCVAEIESRGAELSTDAKFPSIFFGGGTPSLLAPAELERIVGALRGQFIIAEDAEFTMECNPGTVDLEKLRAYRALGVNRLSFGVQSFHDDDLQFLSRIHTAEAAEASIKAAHAAGFENVNLDLMFSLPQQTPERWLHNLERALELGTTHLSCYSLTVEKGTPLYSMVQRGEAATASEDSDAGLFELTMEMLEARGFAHYEVSNYALPGFECRHNLVYWRHDDYLGFGPSAHSTWRSKRWWNTANIMAYQRHLAEGTSPVQGSEELTLESLRSEYIYLRLRSEGIDQADFRLRFGADFVADNDRLIVECLAHGILEKQGSVLRLTKKGFLVCDELCAKLR